MRTSQSYTNKGKGGRDLRFSVCFFIFAAMLSLRIGDIYRFDKFPSRNIKLTLYLNLSNWPKSIARDNYLIVSFI